jgi:serine/threonine-protein kinase
LLTGIRKIGRYEILDILGEGSMGIVYKALDTLIDRLVAIKTIKSLGASSDPANDPAIKQFLNEARTAGKLNHPNIAIIHDVSSEISDAGDGGSGNGKASVSYIVMEYVNGVTLKDIIRQQNDMPLADKLRILILTARTLNYAHRLGIVHRDIKPANIMVLDDRQIKIMDFGIALNVAAGPDRSGKYPERNDYDDAFTGTPYYMSPEQINREKLDGLSDVFSLGVIAYEFLTGKKPFTADNFAALFNHILNDDPATPHSVAPSLDGAVSAHVMKAVQKEKSRRYQSAGDFADALELYLELKRAGASDTQTGDIGVDKAQVIKMLREKYAFFYGLNDDELLTIFSLCGRRLYRKDSAIFRQSALEDKLYIILKGRVRLTRSNDGEWLEPPLLQTGECFGISGFLNNVPRYVTATAETDCVILTLTDTVLRKTQPHICVKLYKNLSAVLSEKTRDSDVKVRRLMEENKKIRAAYRQIRAASGTKTDSIRAD